MLRNYLIQKGNNAQFVIYYSVFVIIFTLYYMFLPILSHRQVLYLKHIEEEYCCAVNMSKLK